MSGWAWLKRMLESRSAKYLRESREYLHENRNETQKSIVNSKQSGKKSFEALQVAEHALKMLEKHRNGQPP